MENEQNSGKEKKRLNEKKNIQGKNDKVLFLERSSYFCKFLKENIEHMPYWCLLGILFLLLASASIVPMVYYGRNDCSQKQVAANNVQRVKGELKYGEQKATFNIEYKAPLKGNLIREKTVEAVYAGVFYLFGYILLILATRAVFRRYKRFCILNGDMLPIKDNITSIHNLTEEEKVNFDSNEVFKELLKVFFDKDRTEE